MKGPGYDSCLEDEGPLAWWRGHRDLEHEVYSAKCTDTVSITRWNCDALTRNESERPCYEEDYHEE